jgi:uracil-DNA glycosylase
MSVETVSPGTLLSVQRASRLFGSCSRHLRYRSHVCPPGDIAPRANKLADELERKRSLLMSPHMRPLTEHVEEIRSARGRDRVPDFDPTEAGIRARLLVVLEAPGAKATRERGGSGFVSPDNDDGTAENMWWLLRQAGVDRTKDVVTWNIVPWYLGSESKIRRAERGDLEAARPYVTDLLHLLANLRVVVLVGRRAADGWRQLAIDLPTIEVPHPSPQNLNTRPESRRVIRDRLREARERATTGPSA